MVLFCVPWACVRGAAVAGGVWCAAGSVPLTCATRDGACVRRCAVPCRRTPWPPLKSQAPPLWLGSTRFRRRGPSGKEPARCVSRRLRQPVVTPAGVPQVRQEADAPYWQVQLVPWPVSVASRVHSVWPFAAQRAPWGLCATQQVGREPRGADDFHRSRAQHVVPRQPEGARQFQHSGGLLAVRV